MAASDYVRPASLSLQSLATYAPNTLGAAFYHQLADNGLDLEIIKDRRGDVYADARANYIGLRIYQTHDIWHVLLGYSVSGFDELALQAFQLAQTGSAGSAILLCLQIMRTAFRNINPLPPLLNLIFRGWQHGRQTTPLIAVEWEDLLSEPLTDLRERYQILTVSDFRSN